MIVAIGALALLVVAQRDESEMFGGEPETSTTTAPAPAPSPTKTASAVPDFLEPQATDTYVAGRLEEENDKLDIGGLMYLRFEYSYQEGATAVEQPIRSPSLLDLYLDARPNDRVRAYVQGRLNYDPTVSTSSTAATATGTLLGRPTQGLEVLLDQLWLKLDIERAIFVTVGRQRIKWGSGRTWNPTDFLNRDRKNPLDIFDARTGVNLLKVHVPVESLGWNFYAIGTMDDASSPEQIGGAFRAEFLIENTEIAMSTALRKDRPLRFGLDVSTAIWDFDVHAEGAVIHDLQTKYYRFERGLELPQEYSRADDWIPQLVVGADIQIKYSDEDTVILGAEYFFNDAGYDDENLYPAVLLGGTYVPFYLGRHYASLFAMLMNPGSWNNTTFLLAGLSNISDGSVIIRLDYQVRVLTQLNVNVFGMWHTGSEGELRPGFHSATINIEPPLFVAGGGLQVEM